MYLKITFTRFNSIAVVIYDGEGNNLHIRMLHLYEYTSYKYVNDRCNIFYNQHLIFPGFLLCRGYVVDTKWSHVIYFYVSLRIYRVVILLILHHK